VGPNPERFGHVLQSASNRAARSDRRGDL